MNNQSRPIIAKRVEVTPGDWMKIYENRKGSLVFREEPTQLSPGMTINLIAYNSSNGKTLEGLPRLTRKVISIDVETDLAMNKDYIVKIGDEL